MPQAKAPGAERVPLWPSKGFRDSCPKWEAGLDELTGDSHDWLVANGRLLRRGGSAIVGDTLVAGKEVSGTLESKWGARARRMVAVQLRWSTPEEPGIG